MRQHAQRASKPGAIRRRRTLGSRAHRACVNCKEKKLKCDERLPGCANCSRSNLTCLVQDPETKKQRPRNYLELLEGRVALLEGCEQGPTPDVANSSQTAQSPRQRQVGPLTPLTPAAGNEEASDLCSKIGMLDFRTTQMEPQYLGSSSAFAFSHIIHSSLRSALPTNPALNLGSAERDTSIPSPCVLPDPDIALALSMAYFENINTQYPFIHEPTFRLWESQLYEESRGTANTNPDPLLFFVNMVYAVGALLLPNSQTLAEQLYASAQHYTDVLSFDNLEAIQAWLCYAMYSLRSRTGPSLWKLSGLALRQCTELGYHRNIKHLGPSTDCLQLEMRKRVFWCAQGIDCTVALKLGRPLGIRLEDVDAELPLDINDSSITHMGISGTHRDSFRDPPTTMSTAIHVFRLRCLWSRIHTSLNSNETGRTFNDRAYCDSLEQFRDDLESWLASAPPDVPRTGEDLSLFAKKDWFDLNYSYTILILYRGQLAEGKCTPDNVFMDCMQASRNICQGYRRQYVGTSVKYTWGTLHCLFLAGLTYLHCIWTSQAAYEAVQISDVNSTCIDCTMVLVVIAEGWEYAAPYRDIFEALASQTISMMLRGDRTWEASTFSAVSDTSDRENMNRWLADMAGMDMLDVVNELLPGFVEDFGL
ncbi:fungal-specific transcription factor domain-containing protein [Ilyonectria sp. MPI-CAGE-AT-0026]|nr:fungal-specific transcription factor domain-containing protein [Ilyonectria sp. MPI-CAGE-AT-0026]